MSAFKSAFAAARKSGKKVFSFEGKSYTTKLASSAPKKPTPTPTPRPAQSDKEKDRSLVGRAPNQGPPASASPKSAASSEVAAADARAKTGIANAQGVIAKRIADANRPAADRFVDGAVSGAKDLASRYNAYSAKRRAALKIQ